MASAARDMRFPHSCTPGSASLMTPRVPAKSATLFPRPVLVQHEEQGSPGHHSILISKQPSVPPMGLIGKLGPANWNLAPALGAACFPQRPIHHAMRHRARRYIRQREKKVGMKKRPIYELCDERNRR